MATYRRTTVGLFSKLIHTGKWWGRIHVEILVRFTPTLLHTHACTSFPPSPAHSLTFLFSLFHSFLSIFLSSSVSLLLPLLNSVSQDFGDYSESFYSVQTTEGETISQLIANYTDIIVQKMKSIYSEVEDNKDKPVMDFEVDPKK